MAHEVYLLDSAGNPTNAIYTPPGAGQAGGWKAVGGPMVGWKGLSFTPSGGAVDKVPQNRISIPLSDYRNYALTTGATLQIYDLDLAAEVTRGPIIDIEETVDEHGSHWANVTFADQLYDLVRADTTTGFATATGETLLTTMQRLVNLSDATWAAICDIAGLDGVLFSTGGVSVAQAFDKLRQERFGHFRRESVSGNSRIIRLFQTSAPYMAGGLPVWAVAPGASPTGAATNPNMRQMFSPRFRRHGEIANSYTPIGGGNGISALTLRTLYGLAFAGLNPSFPVQRRPQQAGATFDGYDYFIEDAVSIAAYGRTRQTLPQPNISAVVNTSGGVSRMDEINAAIALYLLTTARLAQTAYPVMELSFDTPATADIRNIAGQTIHVQYNDSAFDSNQQTYSIIDVDKDFTVLEVVRNVSDDGQGMDTLTVSTSGEAITTGAGLVLGAIDAIKSLNVAVQPYPMAKPIPKSQNIGPGADMVLTIPADNSMVRRHWALLSLRLEGMVHTRSDNGHTQDVVTTAIPHDIGNAGTAVSHDVGSVPHDVNPLGIAWQIGGVSIGAHDLDYDPSISVNVFNDAAPAGSVAVMWDGHNFYAPGKGGSRSLPAYHLGIIHADTAATKQTTGGGGGRVNPTTGGTGGTVLPTSSATHPNGAGTTRRTTHSANSGFGAVSAHATQESVYRGPAPTGVIVLVDGVQRFGPFNSSPGVMDITPFVSDQNAHSVTVRSPTNGAADAFIDIRDDVTTVAVRPTG